MPGKLRHVRWKDLAGEIRTAIARDNLVLLAAGVAFFALLAVVPGLAAVVAIWGIFARPDDASRVVDNFAAALPDSARQTIEEQLHTVVSTSGAGLGLTALVALLLALWSASTATKFLLQAVAWVYGESAEGSYVRFRGLALLFTLGSIIFALVTIALIAVLPATLARTELGDAARLAANWLRWPLLGLAMLAALSLLYRFGPRRDQRFVFASVGAVVAMALWLIGSAAFAWYSANFGNFNRTYGSMAGVIVLMLWFFLSAFVVVLGAELNVAVEDHARNRAEGDEPDRARVGDDEDR